MCGLWMRDGEVRFRQDLPRPRPAPGEALIRVRRAGICNTDLELMRGYAQFEGVPGHEFVGEVVAGPAALAGRRVVGEINVACGGCARCAADDAKHCAHRKVLGIRGLNGAFAEYTVLPAGNLHAIPATLGDDEAAFVEPLAAAQHAAHQAALGRSDRVIVVGDGKLGQLVARALLAGGGRVAVLGRHPRKLELLGELGMQTSTDAAAMGGDFDVAIDCSGRPEGFDAARAALRAGGTLVLKSTYSDRLPIDVSALVVDEINVVGSRCGDFAPAIAALASGDVSVRPLLDATYPLSRGLAALEHASRGDAMKVQLETLGARGASGRCQERPSRHGGGHQERSAIRKPNLR